MEHPKAFVQRLGAFCGASDEHLRVVIFVEQPKAFVERLGVFRGAPDEHLRVVML